MGSVTITSDGTVSFGLSSQLFPAHRAYYVPEPDEIGLDAVTEGLEHLETAGARLTQNLDAWQGDEHRDEFDWLFPNASLDRQREIASLITGAAQSANLVVAAMCETSGLLNAALPDGQREVGRNPVQIWDLLRAGFVLEGIGQYLVSIGHNMANIGLRCALESPAVVSRISTMPKRVRNWLDAAMEPGSTKPDAWIFHSNSRDLLKAIGGRSRATRPLRVAATLYAAAAWSPMVEGRNESFHRIRNGFPVAPNASAVHLITTFQEHERAMLGLGRAVPSFVLGLQQASPRAARGNSRGTALLGREFVQRSGDTEYRLAIPHARFQG